MTALHAEQDGFDFGVDVGLLESDDELLRLPVGMVEARAAQRAAWRPPVVQTSTQGLAITAQKAEIAPTPEGNPFTFDGETYHIPPANSWDIEVFELIESGKLVTACKRMLGDKQWARFKAKPRKADEFNDFFLASQEALSLKSD